MAIQRIDVEKLTGEKKSPFTRNSQKSSAKDSGGILGGIAQTALAAMPLVPKKYIAMGGGVILLILYGAGSLIWDIISLFSK